MKLTRRHQPLPCYAYCRTHGCGWHDSGSGAPEWAETEAVAHVTARGHEVRIVASRETILTPAQLQAAT